MSEEQRARDCTEGGTERRLCLLANDCIPKEVFGCTKSRRARDCEKGDGGAVSGVQYGTAKYDALGDVLYMGVH